MGSLPMPLHTSVRSFTPYLLQLAVVAIVHGSLTPPTFAHDAVLPPQVLGPASESIVLEAPPTRTASVLQASTAMLMRLPSSNSAGDNLGLAVALSGQTAVAGAWLSDQ